MEEDSSVNFLMKDKVVKNVLPDILDIQNARVSFDINLEDFIWEGNKISPQIHTKIPKNPWNFFQIIGETFSNFLILSQIDNTFKSIPQIPYVVFCNI